MDVHCTTCGEAWDTDHVRHEAIFETSISAEEAQAWRSLPHDQKLSDPYRIAFRAAKWEFGQSVLNIVRCPCCPKDEELNKERHQTKSALEELFGDDEDGFAATLEDYGL